jgi:hypothetical protein
VKKNLSVAIITAIANIRSGKNRDTDGSGTGTGTGTGSVQYPESGFSGKPVKAKEYFWRGFTSPVGDSIGRAIKNGDGGGGRGPSTGG